jgi:hypothetical protein
MATVPPARPDLVHAAILAGEMGYIQFSDSAYRCLCEDADLRGITSRGIRMALRDLISQGGSCTTRNETRQEWLASYPDHPYWYRALVPWDGFRRGIFVEILLVDEEIPFVEVVSIHRQH